jgi:hypothetical protein
MVLSIFYQNHTSVSFMWISKGTKGANQRFIKLLLNVLERPDMDSNFCVNDITTFPLIPTKLRFFYAFNDSLDYYKNFQLLG